jgi:acyl dehydratase
MRFSPKILFKVRVTHGLLTLSITFGLLVPLVAGTSAGLIEVKRR